MALLVSDAQAYIEKNVIDIEDWNDSDDEKKERILNVAERTLSFDLFPDYVIPNEAVYEYAAVIAAFFNDTNRMQQYDVGSFSITGVGSFTFKQGSSKDLYEMVPRTALEMIGRENGVKLTGKQISWTVM